MTRLKPLQEAFVREYLIDLNATQAVIRAGYKTKWPDRMGHQLLENARVAAAIQAARAKLEKRTEITQDRVLRELAKIAFANLSDVTNWGVDEVAIGFDAEGKRLAPEDIGEAVMIKYVNAPFVTPVNRDDLPKGIRASVAEVSLGKDGFKIKMHDKVGALEKIGRTLGMFKDRLDLTSGDKPLTLADFYGRPSADPESSS